MVLQLQLALNLLNVIPVRLRLKIPESLAPVHGLNVMDLVHELWRFPAADAGGGPARALPRGGACPAREPLTSTGAITGAWNQGGGRAEKEEEGEGYSTEGDEDSGEDRGRTSGGRTERGVRATVASPAACQPPETTSLWGGARTERRGQRRKAEVGNG